LAADDDLGPVGGIDAGGGRTAKRPIASKWTRPSRPRSGRLLSKLTLAAILIAAISFFIAPWFALRAVRSAAESHDVQALDELVDMGAVQAGLKTQLAAAPPPAPIDPWKHPLEAMRQALQTHTPIGPDVSGYLTPDALNALLNGRAPGQPVSVHPWPVLRYWGFDRCRFGVSDPANPRRITLITFQHHGWFTWKLSQVRLP
jgi:hypothetical protein